MGVAEVDHVLLAPTQDGRVELIGLEPSLGRVRAGSEGVAADLLSAADPLAATKVPAPADHGRRWRRVQIGRVDRAGGIEDRVVHLQTLKYRLDRLKTAGPLDSLSASALPR